MIKTNLNLGIDIGSTTVKLVLTNSNHVVLFKAYRRHNTQIKETVSGILHEIMTELTDDVEIRPVFTGSGGIALSQKLNQPFVQETISVSESVKHFFPDAKALIDIGGEDAKLIFYNKKHEPDIRMNGNCAGGTGAFIDQMAALLHVPVTMLDPLAQASKNIYPIASRCGVFAKTDIQNLISRKISNEDIAASIFYAVASQVINSLVRGFEIEPKIVCSGGPLRYITYLRKSFADLMHIDINDILVPEDAEIFTALGASTCAKQKSHPIKISELIKQINVHTDIKKDVTSLTPLFKDKKHFEKWTETRNIIRINNAVAEDNDECYIGIDSGSTTTKIVAINKNGELFFNHYVNNQGNPLDAVVNGLGVFVQQLEKENKKIRIAGSAVTGYGEDLIRTALGLDHGIVETIAHYLAAKKVDPKVSFILDIGGQDIKAIFIQNDTINHIEINEACSSGCGSFIENFATTLGHKVSNFAQLATESKAPYDLGSRCTVFMNSKVKQAFKDGASVSDLSAGLAYSVVKNCLYKVLKISNLESIGKTIVVQGGTLKNVAVVRALELLSEKKVVSSDKPELMGAYGAALYAIEKSKTRVAESKFKGLEKLSNIKDYNTRFSNCKGCTNNCYITTFKFPNGNNCFSGNKCEKIFTNSPDKTVKGENIYEFKKEIFFNRTAATNTASPVTIGIPRILNMYDDYPFWHTLFTSCGLQVVLSSDSNDALYKKGYGSIMADNICFPAKIAHGHVVELVEKKVDRIFYPMVVFTQKEHKHSSNCFNCPIVSGYSEVLKDVVGHDSAIKFDSPSFNFKDEALLKKACIQYLKQFKISKSRIERALAKALEVHGSIKQSVQKKNEELIKKARANNIPIVLLAGHPYHSDHMVHQQISQMLSDLGVCVINEDVASNYQNDSFSHYFTVSQWAYPNRILHAAQWLTQNHRDIEFIQLNSFGCGTDAFIIDEISDLLKRNDKSYTLIRIDEISSPGSVKLRLRSLVESVKLKTKNDMDAAASKPIEKVIFTDKDKHRKILVPWFSDFVSPFIPHLAKLSNIDLENIPPSDQEALDHALKYTNNEVCYPALLVVGDIIKVVKSGKYNKDEIAIGITQTGGQCRATNYIALIKRALEKAGYNDIPVVSIASGSSMQNLQPGFQIDWLKILIPTLQALFFTDCLSRMYHSTRCRELKKGQTFALKEKFMQKGINLIRERKHNSMPQLLKEAVKEFNLIPTSNDPIQVVGIVGEIYVKYNNFGQYDITNWLLDQHIDVAIPPLSGFFLQELINTNVNKKANIYHKSWGSYIADAVVPLINRQIQKYEIIMKDFRHYRPVHTIKQESEYASEIVSLVNQYGEGWLIPGEIASFAKHNITKVLCLQPFGCLANQVIGKGVEKRIRHHYPDVNILFLDFDYGTSRVNVLNRLHFLFKENKWSHATTELSEAVIKDPVNVM